MHDMEGRGLYGVSSTEYSRAKLPVEATVSRGRSLVINRGDVAVAPATNNCGIATILLALENILMFQYHMQVRLRILF
jgi:hypothetical protein